MYLLALESTCDETAAAVIGEGPSVLASVVASQDDLHRRFGGVVPEIASRAHVERILPVIDSALKQAGIALSDLGGVAVASGPGLTGSLLVSLMAAKTLAVALDLPLVAVDHLQSHIYACRLAAGREVFPCVGLVVSGGHTSLYRCSGPTDFELLGGTIDDAAGEAFDKVANMLGLGYPGGPAISIAALKGNAEAHHFPRSFVQDLTRLDFSFSGLKTAVRYEIAGPGEVDFEKLKLDPMIVADIAASFQEAVVDCLVAKSLQALLATGLRTLCVGGGVAANRRLRERLESEAKSRGLELHVAPLELCTDNAAMHALAFELLVAGRTAPPDLDVAPGMVRQKK